MTNQENNPQNNHSQGDVNTAGELMAAQKNAAMGSRIRTLCMIALMSAVLCILGPMSIPIGPVPISLTNLTIYLFLYILDMKKASVAYLVYLLIGLIGLPVFSGYTGGAPKLFGPTGGYLIGFLPMIWAAALVVERHYQKRILCILAMEAATWIPYLLGTAWLAYSAHMGFRAALGVGVLPFLVVDLCKIAFAAIIGPELKSRLVRAGL